MEYNSCVGSFRYPPYCSGETCIYEASWKLKTDGIVEFSVTARNLSPDTWVAIGINPLGQMPGSDIIFYNPITGTIIDKTVTNDYVLKEDIQQNFLHAKFVKPDATTVHLTVERKLDTGDQLEDVSLNQCVKFLFPVKPGRMDQYRKPSQHAAIPIISDADICFQNCNV